MKQVQEALASLLQKAFPDIPIYTGEELMANIFSFQLDENFLTAYAQELKQLRENNPGKAYKVTISVDLIPDGIGYEIREPPQITIDEAGGETEEVEPPDLVKRMHNRIDDPYYNELGEDEPLYHEPEDEDEVL